VNVPVPDIIHVQGNGVGVADFLIARTQTTNQHFVPFGEATGRDTASLAPAWGLEDDNPVVNLNWYDCVRYANWLSDESGLEAAYLIDENHPDPANSNQYDSYKWTVQVRPGADGFRLPTEAEWEYAARGGRKTQGFQFAGSDDLTQVGWYMDNTDRTQRVATKKPNELLLSDMSGNVWEWCWDWYTETASSPAQSPSGPGGTYRVIRGGSWNDSDDSCLVLNRNYGNPHVRSDNYGFRLARSAPHP